MWSAFQSGINYKDSEWAAAYFNRWLYDLKENEMTKAGKIINFSNGFQFSQRVENIGIIIYDLNLAPHEMANVTTEYSYQLGGNQYGEDLYYFLTPAKYYASFSNLTINVTLGDNQSNIYQESTSLPFIKTGNKTYQYKSATLPEVELKLDIRTNETSPWEVLVWVIAIIMIVVPVIIIFLIIFFIIKTMKKRKNNKEEL